MGNLKIGVRLWIGFASVVVLIISVALFAYTQLKDIKEQTDALAKGNFIKAQASSDALEAMQNVYRSILICIIADNPADKKREVDYIEKQRTRYRESLKTLETLETNAEGKTILEAMKLSAKNAAAANNKALELAVAGKQAEAEKVIRGESLALMQPILDSFNKMGDFQKKRVDFRYGEAVAHYRSAITGLAIGCSIAVLIAITCAVLITRSITRPIAAIKEVMRDIAEGEGDLTKNMNMDSKDEIGELAKWFDVFMDKIQADMTVITATTHQVASAAVQLHRTAEQIATGSEEVAAQAGTVATAGEEMSATSGEIAQNCSLAAEGSRQASAAAVSGAKVVDETIAVMNRIAERVKDTAKTVENLGSRSEQIGEIVGTIQDIADQTNLLALNAAIEAARAGEQGRGFAVVADEVRALAERTTKATKEISEMIRVIQNETRNAVSAMEIGVGEVVTGSEKAAESGRALESILEQINEVTMQINQVATAAEEQTATTSEISSNMHQITEVVSHTSRGAQESATAANQLSGLAGDLSRIVNQFKV